MVERYLKKGMKVYIEGQLETRKWQDQQGNDRYSTEVALRPFRSELHMLDGKAGGSAGDDRGNGYGAGGSPSSQPSGRPDFDDSIPFLMEWRA